MTGSDYRHEDPKTLSRTKKSFVDLGVLGDLAARVFSTIYGFTLPLTY